MCALEIASLVDADDKRRLGDALNLEGLWKLPFLA